MDANLSALRKQWGQPGWRSVHHQHAEELSEICVPRSRAVGEVGGGCAAGASERLRVLGALRPYSGRVSRLGRQERKVSPRTGDFNAVPEAPAWLLAEMKAAKVPSGVIKNKPL